jgi:putative toxin-antitoxin system antitoxin component (TIGR02293 family)
MPQPAATPSERDQPSLYQRIGSMLGLASPVPASDEDLVRLVEERLPVGSLSVLSRHAFSEGDICHLILPRRTLSHRRAKGERLSREESDRAVRIARIAALAEQVFGAPAPAARWLRTAKHRFGGHPPLAMLATEAGARLVEEILYQIDDGMAA